MLSRPANALLRVAVLALIAVAIAACAGEPAPEPEASTAPSREDPRAAEIQAGFVGSTACKDCHAEAFAAWQESRHSAVVRPGDTPAYVANRPGRYDANGVRVVHPEPQNGRVEMLVERGGAPGSFPVDAVIGGERMEAYITRLDDGAWVLLPLYYQTDDLTFSDFTSMTCGAEIIGGQAQTPGWAAYDRVWSHRCIACHVTAGAIGFDPATSEYDTSWVEPGVGCESCHGPGEAHVTAAKSGDGAAGIVNPGSMDPDGAAQVCASCHSLVFPFESRWGGGLPYRAGDAYEAAFLPLLRPVATGSLGSLTHADHTPAVGAMEYQGLSQSLCALRGGATCGSCHDPHGKGVARHQLLAPVGSGALCADCHAEVVAQGEAHSRHAAGSPGGACVDCHMAPTVQALGTRLANHAIDVPLPVNNVDYGVEDACTLCHADRGAAWAAGKVVELWGAPEARRRRRLMRTFQEADVEQLRALLADADESPLLRSDAAHALGRAAGRQAAPDLIRALDGDPSLGVRRHVADLLGNMGPRPESTLEQQIAERREMEEAGVTEALRRAADSEHAPLRLAAGASLARLGTADGLERLAAMRADPELDRGYRLHQILGKYHLLNHEFELAAGDFERVLERVPNFLPVIDDLGFVYFNLLRFEDARDTWQRGLAINPDNESLREKIHLAEDQIFRREQKDDQDLAAPESPES